MRRSRVAPIPFVERISQLTRLYAHLPGPQKPYKRYEQLPVHCDLSGGTIAECVNRGLPVSRVYTLNVHPQAVWDARYMISEWTGRYPNPVAPLVNVIPNERVLRFEWFIESEGFAIGSCGC